MSRRQAFEAIAGRIAEEIELIDTHPNDRKLVSEAQARIHGMKIVASSLGVGSLKGVTVEDQAWRMVATRRAKMAGNERSEG